jgi:hypothetical protein
MTNIRKHPPSQRLIRSCEGLFFTAGKWTVFATEATVFSTVREALQVRRRFALEEIQLVTYSEQYELALSSN